VWGFRIDAGGGMTGRESRFDSRWSSSCTTATARRREERVVEDCCGSCASTSASRRRSSLAIPRRSVGRAPRRAAARWARARGVAERCVAAARAWSMRTTFSRRSLRALAAARAAAQGGPSPAPVPPGLRHRRVLHAGAECTRCHGRDTRPGVRLNCRGQSGRGGGLRRIACAVAASSGGQADALIVPKRFLRASACGSSGRRCPGSACTCWLPPCGAGRQARCRAIAGPTRSSSHALAAEKGVDVASDACRLQACLWWWPWRA